MYSIYLNYRNREDLRLNVHEVFLQILVIFAVKMVFNEMKLNWFFKIAVQHRIQKPINNILKWVSWSQVLSANYKAELWDIG